MNNIARVRKRIFAALIDYTLYFLLFAIYIFMFGDANGEGGYKVEGARALPLVLLWFIYFPAAEGISGQTIGKKILGIRLATSSGKDIGFGTALVRRLLDVVDMSFAGLVGIIVMKSSDNNRRVGDHVANTIIITEDISGQCQYCNEELSLTAQEFQTRVFTCPKCQKQNTPLDLVDA
jgi:uncharacterized RDD family membrane protein YckC